MTASSDSEMEKKLTKMVSRSGLERAKEAHGAEEQIGAMVRNMDAIKIRLGGGDDDDDQECGRLRRWPRRRPSRGLGSQPACQAGLLAETAAVPKKKQRLIEFDLTEEEEFCRIDECGDRGSDGRLKFENRDMRQQIFAESSYRARIESRRNRMDLGFTSDEILPKEGKVRVNVDIDKEETTVADVRMKHTAGKVKKWIRNSGRRRRV